ncbi:MAG: DUF2207 domain-containing protein [Alphaproteobacteria bacterium]
MFFRALFFSFIIFAFAGVASAKEAITDFDVTIDVAQNGDFVVTERITVNVEGITIKRGIFRDLPRYAMLDDYKLPQRYKFLYVTRNGENETFAVETADNAKRLRIGDGDVFIPHGLQTYEISYAVKDQIRRDPTFDEVYWNVTGNYWRYAIDKASVTVNMPDGVRIQSHKAYTGKLGATESDAVYSEVGDAYKFAATRPFEPKEGLTISLRFYKGVIAPQPESTKRFIWWVKNGALSLLSLSLLGIFWFYYRAWNKRGRDPAKGPLFARYAPPKNYSPAASSHIHYKGIRGNQALVATLMGLAIKDYIDLETDKKKTSIRKKEGTKPLFAEEKYLYESLFSGTKKIITLTTAPNASFNADNQSFQKRLGEDFGEAYFKWNGLYMLIGFVLSAIAIGAAVTQLYGVAKPYFWAALGGLVFLNVLFIYLLPAPTNKGQKIMSEIDGFRLYLKTAEKQRLNAHDIGSQSLPMMSVDHYETMLPYAIALGVEEPWTKYFEATLPAIAKAYNPSWAGMSQGHYNGVSNLTNSMVSNISSGVSSAAPQSSGSSSGGGSSGGGGGGGGGGGW